MPCWRATRANPRCSAYDVISIPQKLIQSAALSAIRSHLANVIQKYQPDEVAVEGIIYVQSHHTAITMGPPAPPRSSPPPITACRSTNTRRAR